MNQQKLQEKTIKKQEMCMQEMQQAITLLKEENRLQKELIHYLQEENEMLQKHAEDYARVMRQMLDETSQKEDVEE